MSSNARTAGRDEERGAVRPVSIVGTGYYVPDRVLTNADLEKMVDTTDDWIVTRSGIKERRIATDSQSTSDLATQAALRALKDADVAPEDLDLVLVGTSTPDMPFPNTGCLVQKNIGAKNAAAFSMEAACSSFLFGIEMARQSIASGARDTVLVVGADKISAVVDWEDRSTCVLFGDGSGAVVLGPAESGRGLMSCVMRSDGDLSHLLKIPAGGSRMPASAETVAQKMHFLKMEGREVFKHAVTAMTASAKEALKASSMTIDDVDCVIPHQANVRIINAIADRLGGGHDKYFVNVDRYGNMSAASVAVALCEAVETGRVKRGDIVLLIVFGAGFTWGSILMEY